MDYCVTVINGCRPALQASLPVESDYFWLNLLAQVTALFNKVMASYVWHSSVFTLKTFNLYKHYNKGELFLCISLCFDFQRNRYDEKLGYHLLRFWLPLQQNQQWRSFHSDVIGELFLSRTAIKQSKAEIYFTIRYVTFITKNSRHAVMPIHLTCIGCWNVSVGCMSFCKELVCLSER